MLKITLSVQSKTKTVPNIDMKKSSHSLPNHFPVVSLSSELVIVFSLTTDKAGILRNMKI